MLQKIYVCKKNIYMLQKIYVCKKNMCARIFGKLIWSVLLTLFSTGYGFHYAVGFLLITQKL